MQFPVPFQLLDPTKPCAWIDATNWNQSGNYFVVTSRESDPVIHASNSMLASIGIRVRLHYVAMTRFDRLRANSSRSRRAKFTLGLTGLKVPQT